MFYLVSSPWSPAPGVIEIPKIQLYNCNKFDHNVQLCRPVVCGVQSADIVSAWKQQQTAVLIKLDNNLASQVVRLVFRLQIYISEINFTKLLQHRLGEVTEGHAVAALELIGLGDQVACVALPAGGDETWRATLREKLKYFVSYFCSWSPGNT